MGCSGVLWDVPGCSGVVPGCSGGVPGVFRWCSGVFRGVPGVFRVLQTPQQISIRMLCHISVVVNLSVLFRSVRDVLSVALHS